MNNTCHVHWNNDKIIKFHFSSLVVSYFRIIGINEQTNLLTCTEKKIVINISLHSMCSVGLIVTLCPSIQVCTYILGYVKIP